MTTANTAHPDVSASGERRSDLAPVPAAATTSALGGLTVERVTDLAAVAALRSEWEGLLADCAAPNLFLTWEWHHSWLATAGADHTPEVLVVRRRDLLVALVPLARAPRWRAPADATLGRSLEGLLFPSTISFMGGGLAGADDLDLIVRRGEEDAVLEAIASAWDDDGSMLELCRVPADDSQTSVVAQQLVSQGWEVRRRTTDICPVVDLEGVTWDTYLGRLGSSHRQNVRRRLRKLDADFDVELERIEDETQVDPAIDLLVELHEARWQAKGTSDAFGPELVRFHRALARRCLDRGWLRLFVLRLDRAPAAALYGFRYGDRFLYYQSGFDPAFSRHSVGLALMAMVIRSAIDEGAREFDMLHGDESYKFHWADDWRELERFELYPPSRFSLRHRLREGVREARTGLLAVLGREPRDLNVPGGADS